MEENIQIPQGNWEQIAMGWKAICLQLLLMDDEQFKKAKAELLSHLTCGRDFANHVQNAIALSPETFKQQSIKTHDYIAEQQQRELQYQLVDTENAKRYFKK
jgi:hypothetical protein